MNILVLYPKVKTEYQIIFTTMINGIKNNPGISTSLFEVNKHTTPGEVESWIERSNGQVLVTLGKRSFNISTQITSRMPAITGGMVTPIGTNSGISLMGDPLQFTSYLNMLAPKVKRIHIVYSEKNSGWLMPKISMAAKRYNLEVIAQKAETVQQAALAFQKILRSSDLKSDALWLLMDRVIPDAAILPSILKTVWEKNLVVLSSNPGHVKRGILFALYPDYEKMGKEIAILAIKSLNNPTGPTILPTKDMRSAINVRTASHLGLNITPKILRRFNLIFPSP